MTRVIWALIGALTLVLVIDIAASAWMSHFISKKERQYFMRQIDQDIDSIFYICALEDTILQVGTKWIKPALKFEEDFDKKLKNFVDGQSHQINDQLKLSWEAIFNQYGSTSLAEVKRAAKLIGLYQKYSAYTLDTFESDMLEMCKTMNLSESGDYIEKIDKAEICYTGLSALKRKLDAQQATKKSNAN